MWAISQASRNSAAGWPTPEGSKTTAAPRSAAETREASVSAPRETRSKKKTCGFPSSAARLWATEASTGLYPGQPIAASRAAALEERVVGLARRSPPDALHDDGGAPVLGPSVMKSVDTSQQRRSPRYPGRRFASRKRQTGADCQPR